jgi:Phosphotransferase enzyme family
MAAKTACASLDATRDGGESLSNEQLRKLLKPTPTEADAANVVRASFCVDPQDDVVEILCLLDSYDDCNMKICINQKPYLLKFHNGVESSDFIKTLKGSSGDYYKTGHASSVIHLQNAMLWTLQNHGIPTSAPVHPVKHDGNDDDVKSACSSPVSIHTLPVADDSRSPAELVVRLYEWIPGRPLSSIPLLPLEIFADVGRILGRLHTALDSLSANSTQTKLVRAESSLVERQQWSTVADQQRSMHLKDPSLLIPARRFHQWDGKNTKELRGYLSYIRCPKRRGMIESIITAFDQTLVQTGLADRFRKGINHGDFNGMYDCSLCRMTVSHLNSCFPIPT